MGLGYERRGEKDWERGGKGLSVLLEGIFVQP